MIIKHNQIGASLIEALIAIFVLSIGLLGMVGMQTASMKYEQSSWVRSALSDNIANLADRIRANPNTNPANYSSAIDYAEERIQIEASNTYLVPGVNCNSPTTSVTCSDTELAAYDLAVWRSALNNQMPGAVGSVLATGTKGANLRFEVTVAWADKDFLENGVPIQAPTCEDIAADGITGIAARNCCPESLDAPAGVRCTRVELIP